MKRIDIFCASQAATAICLSMEEPSPSSSPSLTIPLAGGGRAIDRYNPIIRDSRRIPTSLPSHPPLTPKPQKLHQYKKKKNKKIPTKENEDQHKKKSDEKIKNSNGTTTKDGNNISIIKKGWSCTKPGDFISPPGSTRYLLRDKADFPNFDPAAGKLSLEDTSESKDEITEEYSDAKPHDSSPDQVVVLRVSLHCRGCERKLRKHLSKMEGVTSFDIEFAAKKVTVAGKVTPSGVLSSISKVKNAQLWSPAISSSIPQSASEFKNEHKGSPSIPQSASEFKNEHKGSSSIPLSASDFKNEHKGSSSIPQSASEFKIEQKVGGVYVADEVAFV